MSNRCAKCHQPSPRLWQWIANPCAYDKMELEFWLCDECDIARNRELLELGEVEDAEERMDAYAAKVRARVH